MVINGKWPVLYYVVGLQNLQNRNTLYFTLTSKTLEPILSKKLSFSHFFEYQLFSTNVTKKYRLLKTVAFIAGKKIQQSKKFSFVFPLKQSFKNEVRQHPKFNSGQLKWFAIKFSMEKRIKKFWIAGNFFTCNKRNCL